MQNKASKSSTQPRHILLLGGLSLSLVNFRGPLIRAMLANGHRVTAVAGDHDPEVATTLSGWGADYIVLPFARSGMNPLGDLRFLWALVSLMRRLRPNVFFGYTVKAATYGLLAARVAGVPQRYAMITGLGYPFIEGPEFKRRIARIVATGLYRVALKHADIVIFQNFDDRDYFKKHILGDSCRTEVVGGSGVDLSRYLPVPAVPGSEVILMVSRLLRDKGVIEFAQAARLTKEIHPSARFVLVGPLDPSPDAITAAQVQVWVDEGMIEYRGPLGDIRPEIAACRIFMLPSYREGMPRTVLEAMAMGRPIITTDAPGCRETVSADYPNGILVPPKNATALAAAANRLLAMSEQHLQEMGEASLKLVRERFDARKVTADIIGMARLD